MKYDIKIIPHKEQQYETCGNWWFDNQSDPVSAETVLKIRVSKLGNEDYENLIVEHEMAEALLCLKRGINQKDVTAFDKTFEEARIKYPTLFGELEPGDHPLSPYRNEHTFAERMIEQPLAGALGVDWGEYTKACNEL